MLLAALLLVACGGQSAPEAGPVDVFREFAQAAAEQDGDRLWSLISSRVKARISEEEFTAPSVLRHLRDDYAPVAAGRTALDVGLGEESSLVALAAKGPGPGAQAAILRLEEGNWRVQLTELDLGFGTGERDFTVNARSEDRRSIVARGWIDGQEVLVKRVKETFASTFRVVSKNQLAPGRHTAVAYVEAGEQSGAMAWTFER